LDGIEGNQNQKSEREFRPKKKKKKVLSEVGIEKLKKKFKFWNERI